MSDDLLKFLNLLATAGSLALIVGSMFSLGVVAVCRLLSWAPVNTHIFLHNHFNEIPSPAADGEVG